jgi:predicted regulator of Ras-like GTPase activity (Roadblock/LC7/MglB family)
MPNKLDQVHQDFHTELGPDFFMSMIVGMDGLSISNNAAIEIDFFAAEGAARMAMIAKLADKVSAKLGIGKMEDDLVTIDQGYLILRNLGDGSYFWVLAVPRTATLGTVRMLMAEYAPKLWDAIPR